MPSRCAIRAVILDHIRSGLVVKDTLELVHKLSAFAPVTCAAARSGKERPCLNYQYRSVYGTNRGMSKEEYEKQIDRDFSA